MKTYTIKECEKIMNEYNDLKDGEVVMLDDGVLGLGTVILVAPNLKTLIIKERYLSPWTSTHTITKYNKTPKKYLAKLI